MNMANIFYHGKENVTNFLRYIEMMISDNSILYDLSMVHSMVNHVVNLRSPPSESMALFVKNNRKKPSTLTGPALTVTASTATSSTATVSSAIASSATASNDTTLLATASSATTSSVNASIVTAPTVTPGSATAVTISLRLLVIDLPLT